jgi:hypothetical protein
MLKSAALLLPVALCFAGCASKPGSPLALTDAKQAAEPKPDTASERSARVPAGTAVRVRLDQALDTARNRAGDRFTASLATPVRVDEKVVLPKNTPFSGRVVSAKPSGRLRGRAYMALALDSFELDGKTYRIHTSSNSRASSSHKKRNLALIGGGSGLGALIGGIAGGGKGALIGAGAGAAAGTTGAAITGRKNVRLPAETVLSFVLREPVIFN